MVKSAHTLSNGSAGARSIALIVPGQGTPLSRYRATGFIKCSGQVILAAGYMFALGEHLSFKADETILRA
jgi:hypothetical protein